MKYEVLGVKIDQISMSEALDQIAKWASNRENEKPSNRKYVVTPNVEFLMLAQKDPKFKKILNEADLAIPDSARLSWAYKITHTKSLVAKLLLWPTFFLPPTKQLNQFDVVTGTDLMDQLIKVSSEKGFTIGLLGGGEKLADKLSQVLTKKYPNLKISFASSEVVVDSEGEVQTMEDRGSKMVEEDRKLKIDTEKNLFSTLNPQNSMFHVPSSITKIPPTDILFVALGQGKQEKWIAKNLRQQPVKVMIGVGGAFDYLSGQVPRAPKMMRNLGLEWLYRIVNQPWRAKRFIAIFKFLGLVLKS